jgi:RNase adapter protein RapZ
MVLRMTADRGPDHKLVLITGPSGAGRTTAIRVLEDLGYEGIDNIPLSLVPRLIDGPPLGHPIALGLDVRNRDFNATALIELIDSLTRDPRVGLEVLYLDCAPAALISRYSETRRRHPLAPSGTPAEGIEREIDLLAPIRVRADHLIDTTELTVHDLKAEIARWFDAGPTSRLAVSVQSFSYKRGVPRGVDMIFDCRFLANPHWSPGLRPLDGRDPRVEAHVHADPRFAEFYQKLSDLLLFLLPANLEEGKAHLSIGFGCTGGQHRSVAVAEMVGNALAEAGWPVSKRHRELERRAASGQPDATKVTSA